MHADSFLSTLIVDLEGRLPPSSSLAFLQQRPGHTVNSLAGSLTEWARCFIPTSVAAAWWRSLPADEVVGRPVLSSSPPLLPTGNGWPRAKLGPNGDHRVDDELTAHNFFSVEQSPHRNGRRLLSMTPSVCLTRSPHHQLIVFAIIRLAWVMITLATWSR